MSGLCHEKQFPILRNMCVSVFTAQGYLLFVVLSPQKSVIIGKINVTQFTTMLFFSMSKKFEIPWTEEPGRRQSRVTKSRTQLKQLSTHTHH